MKEHLYILKCMHKASPSYLFVNLLQVVVSYIAFALLLPFSRYIVNSFLYGEADYHKITIAFLFYLAVKSVSEFFTYWVTQVYNQLQYIKIEKYMNGLVYEKCQWIDIACYENTDMYNQYVRALEDGPQRVTGTGGGYMRFCLLAASDWDNSGAVCVVGYGLLCPGHAVLCPEVSRNET